MSLYELLPRYRALFTGFDEAYGTGQGRWVKAPPGAGEYLAHLEGRGPGLGIGPLMRDGTVKFAAIDLDAPDFDLAREFQRWIPGPSFIERSRSGNAHVWVFFKEPCPAWVATGLLHYAIESSGAKHVEVFPKQTSFSNVVLGNYINLPYYGGDRPVLCHLPAPSAGSCGVLHPSAPGGQMFSPCSYDLTLEQFLDAAEDRLNDPVSWEKRAGWLMIDDPATRKRDGASAEFGTQRNLHMCAEYVIEGAMSGERPVLQGSRSVVYFNLAKQLANCELWTAEEALEVLLTVRDASDEFNTTPKPTSELARYVRNAYEKQYTSTGCDDPVFQAYAHPDCPIAHPRR